MASKRFESVNDVMLKRMFRVNPQAATAFGMHDPYDHLLPHGGVKRLTDTMSILDEWYGEALKLADGMSFDQRISLRALRMACESHRFALEDYPIWRLNPDALELPGYSFLVMLNRGYSPLGRRLDGISSRIGELPRYLAEFRTRFDGDAHPVRMWTESAIHACSGFPSFLDHIKRLSVPELNKASADRLDANIQAALPEVKKHGEWLEALLPKATGDLRLGGQNLAKILKIRGFSQTPDEMLAIAERHLRSMKADRETIARRMSPEGTLDRAYRIVRDDTPKDFDGVLASSKEIVESARKYIQEHDLATLRPDADLKIVESPDFMAQMVTTAALDMAAPFENIPRGILMETRTESREELEGVWNRSMIINTATHEAYPGHFHQGVMSSDRPWMHQMLTMLMAPDTMVTSLESQEGWALYAERMMYENGYEHNDPAALMILDGGLWRAVRVIYDIKLARGEATIDEMSRMLSVEASMPLSAAESDVKSFTRTPGYPLSYLIGWHMVAELKKELEHVLGDGFELKRFNDLLARNGNLPFFLAREAVKEGFGLPARIPD